MNHTPTDEQALIIKEVASATSNLMISAYAGTAKSTTLEMAAPGVHGPALALAFNRKIASELQDRLPQNFKAQTLNSIGHGAWIRAINKPTVKVDGQKLGKLVTAIAKDHRAKLMDWQWDCIRTCTSNAMKAGMSPNNIGQPLTQDTPENWREIILEEIPSVDDFDFIYTLSRATLQAEMDTARAGQLSFDDQVWAPTVLGGVWPKYPVVFVDESQDLSPLNHRMLQLVSNGLIVAVGDPRQAIYLFRGADANSMTSMRAIRSSWTDLSLTTTFRCPRAIVARQQDHAPGFKAHSSNIDGQFIQFPQSPQSGYNHQSILDAASSISAREIAILCRNNAPLVDTAFRLIRNGIGCKMLGRDIGTGLIRLISKLEKDDETPILKFSVTLTDWLNRECAIAQANDKPERADKLTDQAECIRATIEGSSPTTVGELKSVLNRIFSRDSGQITLSSVHRAKGLEWPLVVHLDPWRIPSKQAKLAAIAGNTSQLEQEYNLAYVAETRTKNTLINADSKAWSS